jgi:poly-gamma-glutamate capsule biosynthesis protein CapA/YwtB (metallophosphatase superfamily)
MKFWHKVAIILVLLIATGLYIRFILDKPKTYRLPEPELIGTEEERKAIPENDIAGISLAAVGDIIMHTPVVDAAKKQDGTYDFVKLFNEIKPYIEKADISICNFETTIGKPYSGYPRFRSPEGIADTLKHIGFDVFTTANNHCFDFYEQGLINTVKEIRKRGIGQTGTYISKDDREKNGILFIEAKGIKLAIIAYTYGCNGLEDSVSQVKLDYMVNLIANEKAIESDIKKAKENGADLIIAAIHWGSEDVRTTSREQTELAKSLVSKGIDIILGSHPHVLQKIEIVESSSTEGEKRTGLIAYSLGNFISNQRARYNDSGMILSIKIQKNLTTNKTAIGEVTYIPTWVYRFRRNGKYDYRVLPVAEFMDDESLPKQARNRMKQVWEETTSLFGYDKFRPHAISQMLLTEPIKEVSKQY